MIDMVVQGLDSSVVQDSAEGAPQEGKGRRTAGPAFVTKADPELLDWLKDAETRSWSCGRFYTLTLIPHVHAWDGPRCTEDTGRLSIRAPFLIPLQGQPHETQKARAIDENEAIDMPEVYSAINHIQNVPWRIKRGSWTWRRRPGRWTWVGPQGRLNAARPEDIEKA